MLLKVYVDASFADYGAILLGDGKIITIFSCGAIQPYKHSTTLKMKGFVGSLHAFRSYVLGQQFTIYSNNCIVLRLLHGRSSQALVLRETKEIMALYPDISFVEGKANHIVDFHC